MHQAPSAAPQVNITGEATTAAIMWDKVPYEHRNGIILGYEFQLFNTKGFCRRWSVDDEGSSYYLLEELVPDTKYYLTIAGYNEAGVGVSSPLIPFQTSEEMDAIQSEKISRLILPIFIKTYSADFNNE